MPEITRRLADEALGWALVDESVERCGIWFFPDVGAANFLPLPNHHDTPERHFKVEYDDIERAILGLYGESRGRIAIFHTHPQIGLPSPDDVQLAETFEKQMDGHPLWRMTERHLIYSTWDLSWWWFDLVAFGRCNRWPEP